MPRSKLIWQWCYVVERTSQAYMSGDALVTLHSPDDMEVIMIKQPRLYPLPLLQNKSIWRWRQGFCCPIIAGCLNALSSDRVIWQPDSSGKFPSAAVRHVCVTAAAEIMDMEQTSLCSRMQQKRPFVTAIAIYEADYRGNKTIPV